jgi:hypothetical protein
LQQHDLRVVQTRGDRQPPELIAGQRQGLLRGPQLLAQPYVLLGQLAVLGPGTGQLLFQVGDGPVRVRPWLPFGVGKPPDQLHEQPPGQLVIIEVAGHGTGHGTGRCRRAGHRGL